MVDTRKYSQFPNQPLQQKVGLGSGINSRAPDSSGSSGNITKVINQDTSGLAVNRWVRINSAGLYVLALADTAENADVRGVVLNILGPNQFTLQQAGYIDVGTPGFSGFIPNQDYFLSDTMLGMATQTLPTTNGHINKPLFSADSAESGWIICLSRGMVIGTPGPIPASTPTGTDTNIKEFSQPGNTFMIGDWVRVTGDNVHGLANGNTLANAQSDGVVIQNGDPLFTVQFSGFNSNTVTKAYDSAGVLIPGGIVASTVYYISDVVPGQLTPTLPTNLNSASRPAFISVSAIDGTGWVLPQRPLPSYAVNDPNIKLINQPAHGFLSNGLVVKPQTGALNVGKYQLADSTTLTNSFGVGMIKVIDVDNFYIQEVGYFPGFFDVPPVPGGVANPSMGGTLINGVPLYLSTTPGLITNIEPANPNYSKPIFEADQTNAGWILPMKPTQTAGGGSGSLIQMLDFMQSAPETVSYGYVSGGWTIVPFLTGTITPTSLASKIKLTFMINMFAQYFTFIKVFRDGVEIPSALAPDNYLTIGGTTGPVISTNSYRNIFLQLVDNPVTTLPVTYTIGLKGYSVPSSSYTAYFNSTPPGGYPSGYSTWTLEEYA